MPAGLASGITTYCTSAKTSRTDQNKHLGTNKSRTPCLHTSVDPKRGALVRQKLHVHGDLIAPYFIPCLLPSVMLHAPEVNCPWIEWDPLPRNSRLCCVGSCPCQVWAGGHRGDCMLLRSPGAGGGVLRGAAQFTFPNPQSSAPCLPPSHQPVVSGFEGREDPEAFECLNFLQHGRKHEEWETNVPPYVFWQNFIFSQVSTLLHDRVLQGMLLPVLASAPKWRIRLLSAPHGAALLVDCDWRGEMEGD